METNRIPPNILFKSFLIVAGGYVFSMMALILTAMGIITGFFPDSLNFLSTPDLMPEELMAEPDLILPDNLFWSLLLIHGLISVGIGFVVTWISPFAKFNHAIFLAVILFVGFVQMAIKAPSELQWKFMLMMAAFPIATLLGAKFYGARMPIRE